MKKPTRREFQYDKPFCLIEKDDCVDCFEKLDINNNRSHCCSNCKIAFEHKNRKDTKTNEVKE